MQFRAQGWSLFSTHCFQMLEMRPTKRSAEDVGLGDSTDFFAGDVENHGAKPLLRSKHAWSIRTKLQVEGQTRDLAMFNLAIDSKLRGCDVVALKVEDVAPSGYTLDRATVQQKKTVTRFGSR
jgi:hypothetical protein